MKLFHFLLAATLLASPLSLAAQHKHKKGTPPHGHKAPKETHAHKAHYGGHVRTAGPYHIEMVQQPTEVHVYLLAASNTPIVNARTSGSIMLQTADGTTTRVPLTPAGDHFTASLPASGVLRTAVVYLKSSGRSLSARYEKLDAGKSVARRNAQTRP
ncbi:hypothetical protein [Hymenobacter koreensis]|uniref:Uncharacterized protein n=1 Tax=Hymenobacter koreensis TaxID=1084523 RepID=A0ABP8IZZ1_9BACT